MSTKLAIVDLDGVVADATARFAVAEEAKQRYIEELQQELGITDERGATDEYWKTVFNPEYVYLDTLIPGANDALNALSQQGCKILFLTSRPMHMAEETMEWFSLHVFIEQDCNIVMKAPAFQYVKTVVWKTGMVQTLVALYGASDVLIVEDEQANINEHLKYVSAEVQTRQIYKSLAEAVEALKEE